VRHGEREREGGGRGETYVNDNGLLAEEMDGSDEV
jgi:hypothetical protein